MFSEAYEKVSAFTRPLLIPNRRIDNTIDTIGGTFIVLNKDGWILTVSHHWNFIDEYKKHKNQNDRLRNEFNRICSDTRLSDQEKFIQINECGITHPWVTDFQFWWGDTNVRLKNKICFPEMDLAIGQLDPFNPETINNYPIFKNPNNLKYGTSLCKIGYPHISCNVSFNESSKQFSIVNGSIMSPLVPIEGIYTRDILGGKSKDGRYVLKLIETSSPSIPGQSGGPIFDNRGVIWGINSRTAFAKINKNNEIQFVNKGNFEKGNVYHGFGKAAHPEPMIQFLKDNSIDIEISKE